MCSYLSAIMHMLLLPKKVLKIIKTKQKKEKENNNDSYLGTEGKNCVVAQVTFYANKNNVFLSIEGSWGTPY